MSELEADLLTTFECFRLNSPAMSHRSCLVNRDMAGKLKEGRPTVLGMLKKCLDCPDYAKIKAQHPDFKPVVDGRGNVRYPGPSYVEQEAQKERAGEEQPPVVEEEVLSTPEQRRRGRPPGQKSEPKTSVASAPQGGGQVIAKKEPGILTGDPPPEAPSPAPVHSCPNHSDREQKVNKNGQRTGLCEECLQTRDSNKHLSETRKRTVQLYFHDKHLDLKAWIEQEAEEEERTIPEQIFYTLKKGREAICSK